MAIKPFSSNNTKWMSHRDYGLRDRNKKKLRMPKKADNFGFGFK